MANCKICGKAVKHATVHHAACWELAASKVAAVFCDHYCRFPKEYEDEEELQREHCDRCDLIKLLNLGV